MTATRILFRTVGSEAIGLGHVRRSLALADALDRVIVRSVEAAPKATAVEALANTRVEAAG